MQGVRKRWASSACRHHVPDWHLSSELQEKEGINYEGSLLAWISASDSGGGFAVRGCTAAREARNRSRRRLHRRGSEARREAAALGERPADRRRRGDDDCRRKAKGCLG